jgi:general transcription factor IIIA
MADTTEEQGSVCGHLQKDGAATVSLRRSTRRTGASVHQEELPSRTASMIDNDTPMAPINNTNDDDDDDDDLCIVASNPITVPSTPPRSRSSSRTSTFGDSSRREGRGRRQSESPSIDSIEGSNLQSGSNKSSRASSPRPRRWVCDYQDCTKAYSRPSLLEQHLQTHYNYRPFECTHPGCMDSFLRKDHLERHMLKHMSEDEKPFHCSICGKGVISKQHLKRHERTHQKSFKCPHEGCDESFYKHQSLKVHIRTVHEQGSNKHTCKYCGKEFDRPGRLAGHIEKHHSEASKLMCDFPNCYKTFRVWSALQLHIKTDHPRLECEICGKKCVGPSGLANHKKVHNEETAIKLWKCADCGTKFQKKEDAVKHYAEKHPLLALPEELQYNVRDEKEMIKDKQPTKSVEYYMKKKEEEKREKKRLREEQALHGNDSTNTPTEDTTPTTAFKETDDDLAGLSDTSVSDLGFLVSKPTSSNFKRQQLSRVASSPDVIDLIVDNVEHRLRCPYVSCRRLFRKQYDMDRHMLWHNKQDQKLDDRVDQILSEYDDDLNEGIDVDDVGGATTGEGDDVGKIAEEST